MVGGCASVLLEGGSGVRRVERGGRESVGCGESVPVARVEGIWEGLEGRRWFGSCDRVGVAMRCDAW
jgi:hypothetical protein